MFWVFDEVKRGIYKRTAVMQESENHSKNGANIELSLSDTLEIKGIRLKFFCIFLLFLLRVALFAIEAAVIDRTPEDEIPQQVPEQLTDLLKKLNIPLSDNNHGSAFPPNTRISAHGAPGQLGMAVGK